MKRTEIRPYEKKRLKIYGYTLPQVSDHDGYVKIGETSRKVEDRIQEQVGTAGLTPEIQFWRMAQHKNGEWFHDTDLHRYLISRHISRGDFGQSANEWFDFGEDIKQAEIMTDEFIDSGTRQLEVTTEPQEYTLRAEQDKAVETTLDYYQDKTNTREFLWNAKPRFGKTLTTYDFMLKIGAVNTLIVTNRPAIANSWYDDFCKFIGHKHPEMKFVSETEALKGKSLSREEFIQFTVESSEREAKQVAFISLQDLKGAQFAGGPYQKLDWVAQIQWDLLVIDEAHEGIDTRKTDRAFDNIQRQFTLHLSGTPFKAIANEKFTSDQIYNWSYLDEQQAKANWDPTLDTNPYEKLPTLSLFTYQMGTLIQEKLKAGSHLDNEDSNADYTFDLNEFFSTKENGHFKYKDSVEKFLDSLTKGKMPFSQTQYRHQLNHTFWLLPRVASAKAMEKLLKKHPVFKDYHVVLAAGDGESLIDDEDLNEAQEINKNKKSYEKVKDAIDKYSKTITLSVGQLTTGVTIPEWTAVLMLSNIKSPALYFQAAFRAQNPYEYEKDGQLYRKENAYIFDFAPERTLLLFDEFANNLTPNPNQATGNRQDQIKTLLNFFPVIGEDEQGEMKELNAEEVLTIPRQIKAREVVRQGFMSNLLFKDVVGIFGAPQEIIGIINKIKPEEHKKSAKDKRPVDLQQPMLNDHGEIDIPNEIVINRTKDLFGDKVVGIEERPESESITNLTGKVMGKITPNMKKFQKEFDLNKTQTTRVENNIHHEVQNVVKEAMEEYTTQSNHVQKDYQEALTNPENTKSMLELNAERQEKEEQLSQEFERRIQDGTQKTLKDTVETHSKKVEQRKKNQTENDVRDHLRGFARTIPAFLMAYGNRATTLANFEKNIEPSTFSEITSITIDEFRKLRDGFTYTDDEGQERYFKGFFDEIVFNASIQEFFDKKEELANYFDENLEEDIFDYIPNQKTNQIYTPRGVVKLMVDKLEEENPDIFKQKDVKFIDLYTKSGLYLTELVKRLNDGLADQIPDPQARIHWILENQVYGVAPSDIIYNIAKNYVYGIHDDVDTSHLVQWDMAKSAQTGTMKKNLIEAYGGKEVKFDVVIGNPPYQEEVLGSSARPIYPEFMDGAYEIADKVSLITPARFLFNAGKTSKSWNKKMLSDRHLKVSFYEPKSTKIFPNTDIKGGIVVTYRDNQANYGKLEPFIPFGELRSILQKVQQTDFTTIKELIYAPESYKLTDALYRDHPSAEAKLSKGHKYDVTTNIFEKLPEIFVEDQSYEKGYVNFYGRLNNLRVQRWIKSEYIQGPANFEKYKVFVPKSNGSGALGEVLSTPLLGTPLLGTPLLGHTQTFISIGKFDTKEEAQACMKYIKTKFSRVMLGILKITQDNHKDKWKYVPLQDFTSSSDIDWSQSIPEIDKQLYAKYNLSQDEIQFIETNVQAME